jgi:hypothetical protein
MSELTFPVDCPLCARPLRIPYTVTAPAPIQGMAGTAAALTELGAVITLDRPYMERHWWTYHGGPDGGVPLPAAA